MNQRNLYQEVILEHNRSPRNFGTLEPCSHTQEGRNPICGDHLYVFLSLEDNVIKDIKFKGEGCAISKASASLMTEAIKGKTLSEAKEKTQLFRSFIMKKLLNEDELAIIGKLKVFSGVSEYPGRVKCVLLPWHTLEAATNNNASNVVSTED